MALICSLTIPPAVFMSVPTVSLDASAEEAAAIELEAAKATAHNMGDIYPNAYVRIAHVRRHETEAVAVVLWYKDAESRFQGDPSIQIKEYLVPFVIPESASVEEAYAYLKTLPEFEASTAYTE